MVHVVRNAPGISEIPAGFPILVWKDLEVVEPALAYLMYIGTVPGRTRSPETLRTYGEHLADWFDTLESSDIAWDMVEESTIATYRNHLLENPSPHTGRSYSRSTINDRVRTICRMYDWAHRHGWIDNVPFEVVDVRVSGREPLTESDNGRVQANSLTLRQHELPPKALSQKELGLLYEQLKMPYLLMAYWAVTTGMRRMELCALKRHQIPHWENPDQKIFLTVTKGGKPRKVHPPVQILDTTRRYIDEERARLIRACRSRRHRYQPPEDLFLGTRGQPITKKRATEAFAAAFRAAGVAGTLHCLRHTYAITELKILEKKAGEGKQHSALKTLQVLLGHSSIATTAIYLRSTEADPDDIEPSLEYLFGALVSQA